MGNDEDRAFVRKSCIRFAFPGDDEDGVVFDTTGCCQCPQEYDGHQAWIDYGVCWTEKPDPACEITDCHTKSYMWYPYIENPDYSGGDYSLACFECRSRARCDNNCSPGGDHGSTGADAPLMDGM